MKRRSHCEKLKVRGLDYNIRQWGEPGQAKLFFLHGWMDSSPTFQFVVDALPDHWHIIAPDWRGYGASQWLGRPYWFPDYYADLECILDHYQPGEAVSLVGHSMGANIAGIYAGIRPERVSQLVMMDFLGLKPPADETALTTLRQWLAGTTQAPALRAYADHAQLARRLRQSNPRLSAERADFLAGAVSHVDDDGMIRMACDPWHKIPAPNKYRVEDAMSAWHAVTARVLLLIAREGYVTARFGDDPAEFARRSQCFRQLTVDYIEQAGHNLQHDQPQQVAERLQAFLSAA